MQLTLKSFGIYLAALLILGCASAKKPATTANVGTKYSEDLSGLRPKVETLSTGTTKPVANTEGRKPAANVEPKYTVNKKLDNILDSIDHYNVQKNFIEGFTIQVYSGLKREEALNAKKELSSTLPDILSEVQYAQPNFRVKVGRYFSRVDAQKDLVDVKRLFPAAIIIPDKVPIN